MNRRNFLKYLTAAVATPTLSFGFPAIIKEPKYHEIVEWAENEIAIHSRTEYLGYVKLKDFQKETLTKWMQKGKLIQSYYSARQTGKSMMGEIFARYKGQVLGEKTLIMRPAYCQCNFQTGCVSEQIASIRGDSVKFQSGGLVQMISSTKFEHIICGVRVDNVILDDSDYYFRERNTAERQRFLRMAIMPLVSSPKYEGKIIFLNHNPLGENVS